MGDALPDRKRFFFYPEDYSVSDTLEKVRLPQARGAVVLADDAEKRSDQDRDVRSILTALTLEKASGEGNIQTCVELLEKTPEKVEVLKMAGVEDVFEGRSYTARLLAHGAHASGLISFFDELFTSHRGCEFSRLSSEGVSRNGAIWRFWRSSRFPETYCSLPWSLGRIPTRCW